MQICTSLQTDNHTSTSLLSFFVGRMPFLPPNQQRQSTEGMRPAIYLKNSHLNWLDSFDDDITKCCCVCYISECVEYGISI